MDYGLRVMLGGGIFFWVIPFFLFLIVMISAYKGFSSPNETDKNSLNILKERYAKGEISEDEYLKIKRELKL